MKSLLLALLLPTVAYAMPVDSTPPMDNGNNVIESSLTTSSITITGGVLNFTIGSTIATNGNSLAITTAPVAGPAVPKNVFLNNVGQVRFNSGDSIDFDSASTATITPGSPFQFAIAASSTNSAGQVRQGVIDWRNDSSYILDLAEFTNSSALIGPTLSWDVSSGTMQSPQGVTTVPSASSIIMRQQVKFYDGVSSGYKEVLGFRGIFEAGISTQSTVVLPTALTFLTTPPTGSADTEKMRITSTGTVAIGLTSGFSAGAKLQIQGPNATNVEVNGTTVVYVSNNEGNNSGQQYTEMLVRKNLSMAVLGCSSCTQTALWVENSNPAVADTGQYGTSYLAKFEGTFNTLPMDVVIDGHANVGVGTFEPRAHVHISSGLGQPNAYSAGVPNPTQPDISLGIDGNAAIGVQINMNGGGQSFVVGASSFVISNTSITINSGMPVTISSAAFLGVSVTTITAGGAGSSVTALCLAGKFAMGGGCLCTGGVALTGQTSIPNCVTAGCVPSGWTCQEPGGTGGACSAYVICSRAQ